MHFKRKIFDKYEKIIIQKKKHAKYNVLPENKLQTQNMEEMNRVGSRTISTEKGYYQYYNCIWSVLVEKLNLRSKFCSFLFIVDNEARMNQLNV